jgi:hypothetical protein
MVATTVFCHRGAPLKGQAQYAYCGWQVLYGAVGVPALIRLAASERTAPTGLDAINCGFVARIQIVPRLNTLIFCVIYMKVLKCFRFPLTFEREPLLALIYAP